MILVAEIFPVSSFALILLWLSRGNVVHDIKGCRFLEIIIPELLLLEFNFSHFGSKFEIILWFRSQANVVN